MGPRISRTARELKEPGVDQNLQCQLNDLPDGGKLQQDIGYQQIVASVARKLFGSRAAKLVQIGRYPVLYRVGAGTMGEIFVCDDLDLGRKVAVKRILGDATPEREARLRAEALALAKLSHANVIQVHELAEHEGQLFMVMEFVEGQTLTQWLSQATRAPEEILAMLIHVGRGLAAAHRAGLVHRDFKPDNVIVGDDGTPRVLDFGLVFVDDGERDERITCGGEGNIDETRLTRTGALMGTVRYMPREQLESPNVDERADQFAFCVVAYEALWGRAPWPAGSIEARVEALEQGAPPHVPKNRRSLYRVVSRGLAHDPNQRWANMDALLEALSARLPSARASRLQAGLGVVLGLSLGLAAGAALWPTPSASLCESVEDELIGVWDGPIRAELADHLASLPVEHVAASQARVFSRLDRWSDAWISEQESACQARDSTSDGAWSARVCLARQQRKVATLVEQLADGDARDLATAVLAVDELGDPRACSSLRLDPEPPQPLQATVEDILARLDEARQHRFFGDADTAELVSVLEAEARALDWGPLLAEVLAEQARLSDERSPRQAAERYDEAITLAAKHGLSQLEAELLIARTELSLHELGELEGAKATSRWAHAAAERAGHDNETLARLALLTGRIAQFEARLDEADRAYVEALELSSLDSFARPTYLDARADIQAQLGRSRELELRRESFELAERLFGPAHPHAAKRLYNLGAAMAMAGRGGEAELERATEILLEANDHRWVAKALIQRGQAALAGGDLAGAETLARSAAELLTLALPESHPDRGEPEQLLAVIEANRDPELALAHGRAALAAFEGTVESQSLDPRAQQMRLLIANQLLTLERFHEAREQLEVLTSDERDSRSVAIAQVRLAEIAVREGDLDDADARLRAASSQLGTLREERVSYELLRGLVDQRRGALAPAQRAALDHARAHHPEIPLEGWLHQLGVRPRERAALGLGAG